MSKTKILVACHKQCKCLSDEIYMPIQVGKALSDLNLGIAGDDSGDNISKKNPFYCELTAQYWGWKNLHTDYIGLCHYRRYFRIHFSQNIIDSIFSKYDIVLPSPMYYSSSMCSKMERALTLEDVAIFIQVICNVAPDYEKATISYLKGNKDIAYNMFLCKKETFDKFCEWQFSILSECERYVKISPYSRLKRIFGYFAEYLLPIYCLKNNLKIKYLPVVDLDGSRLQPKHEWKKILWPLTQFKLPNKLESLVSDAVKVGLHNDNIF